MSIYDEKIWIKSYDEHVKKSIEYKTESIGKIFDDAMGKYPDNVACWMMKREIKYEELREMVRKFATFLQQNGLKKGDRVAINLPNCPQYMVAHFGTLLAGGASSGCSPLLSADEIAYQINDSESKFLVTLDAVYQKVLKKEGVLDKVPKLETIIATNVSEYMGLSKLLVIIGKLIGKIPKGKVKPHQGKNVVQFKDVMLTQPDVKEVTINTKNDLALLQYTGGTTGRPKGTEITHHNLISNLMHSINWLDLKSEEVYMSAFPLFHAAGMTFCHVAVWLSNSQVLIVNPRDTDHFIESWIDKAPTGICNVPTLYLMLMNNEKHKKISQSLLEKINFFVSSAAPFPAESIKEFEEEFNAQKKVCELYGMTETSPLLTMNPCYGEKKIGTVGLPIPNTEIRLVDVDSGEPVELGQPGEIICKGPQVTRGYYKKPEATARTIVDGWLHTGDVGVMDEDGYIKIVDRTKDMLIVSGFKVYSVHVEDVLTKHPDVEIAAIIGLKDPKRPGSEIVKAYITLKEGVEATAELMESIKKYAADNLSKYENPKQWEFRDELPLTLVGKVLKKELREEANK